MSKKIFLGLVLVLFVVSATSVQAFDFVDFIKGLLGLKTPEEETEVFVPIEEIQVEEQTEEESELANPASVFCEKEGGTIDIRTDEEGNQLGICIFEDGTECEEWAYFRGECPAEEPEEIDEEEVPEIVGEIVEEIIEEETPVETEETEEETVETEEVEEIVIEEEPEVIDTEAIVIIVHETEAVSLAPQAEDPDNDVITYSFTTPLDDDGKWLTTYGDEGEYTITVTASDGELSTSQEVLIIVNKKEEAPTIDSFKPIELTINTKEDTELSFSVEASDLNGDPLTYSWKLDGDEVSATESFKYKIGFNDAGSHTVKLDISDNNQETGKIWSLTVDNVNRKPTLAELSDITVKETETVLIEPFADDPDEDLITYMISDPVGDDGVWETSYDDAGEYNIEVSASDGIDTVGQEIKVTVQNVNRPPVIREILQR